MRIGLTARGSTVEEIVEHAQWAEAQGFSSVWYASVTAGDPLVAMALAGRATSSIELGTAILQTYPCHPLLQANRVAAAAAGMGRPGFTLGIGPSHEQWIRGMYGLSYDHPGRNTEEYVEILTALFRNEPVDFDGEDWTAHTPAGVALPHPVPVLVGAMSPRLLRVAGSMADGTVLYLASERVIESRVVPQIQQAATAAGRPMPRIVAGMPVAVHDDIGEARGHVCQILHHVRLAPELHTRAGRGRPQQRRRGGDRRRRGSGPCEDAHAYRCGRDGHLGRHLSRGRRPGGFASPDDRPSPSAHSRSGLTQTLL